MDMVDFTSSPDCHLCTVQSLDVRVGVVFEDLVHPLCVEGHIDEDAGLVGSSTPPAVDTYSDNDSNIPILTHQRAAVIPLAHSLIPLSSRTDLSVGDVEVSSVHLSASGIANKGHVHRF